jgi:hypothetical protein
VIDRIAALSRDAAALCFSLYDYPDSPKVAWEYRGIDDGVAWAMVRLNGVLWVVYRGSVTDLDWERDLYAFYDPFLHDQLGPIHPGFYQGLPDTVQKILAFAKPDEPIGVTGHSLGAGRGSQSTGLLAVAGRPPLTRIVFGEPHSGRDELAKITAPYLGPSYRADGGPNASWDEVDTVTAVPPWFNTPGPRTDVMVTPPTDDPWGAFRFHHMQGYARAVGYSETFP